MKRREFLEHALGAALVFVRPQEGELQGVVPFVDEPDVRLETLVGNGLRGRRAIDLSTLTPETLVTPSERFFVRTRSPEPLPAPERWVLRVRGLVEKPADIRLSDLAREATAQGVHLIECAGNTRDGHFGLMSAADWKGIPFRAIVDRIRPSVNEARVLVSGFDEHAGSDPDSTPGASWVFRFDDLERAGAFLATEMNGAPLTRDHGLPVRLVVPGWYGCVSIKWVNEVALVDDGAPATDQMREFAARTEQEASGPLDFLIGKRGDGSYGPRFAKDFKPATIDPAATAVRVERWRVAGETTFRVVGILWGGDRPTRRLLIRFGPGESYVPVESVDQRTTATWSLWAHRFTPQRAGRYAIQLSVDDPGVRTRRLDRGYYTRTIDVSSV